ncbi:MAG: hypothetical protein AAB538_03450, partial [Patescibacteria group bacterium]
MRKFLKRFQPSYAFFGGAVLVVLLGFIVTAVAAPPGSPYTPGETLAPSCAPGSSNCTVLAPLSTLNTLATSTQTFATSTGSVWTITSSGSAHTFQLPSAVSFFTNDSGYLTAALTSLNGLSGAAQTFASSTSGTIPSITSSGSTHTFNWPTASGTNTGFLSSGDWTTFNNKLSSAITSLGGLTGASQTFATSSADANLRLSIGSSGTTHTFTPSWNGTLAVSRGGTGLSTFGGTNTLLYTTAADTLASITTANSSILATNGSGVPAWGTTLPAFTLGGAVTGNSQALTGLSQLTVTGTSATSTFSTAGFTVGTSRFVVQEGSGNIGIGTTTPANIL